MKKDIKIKNIEQAVRVLNKNQKDLSESTESILRDLVNEKVNERFNMVMEDDSEQEDEETAVEQDSDLDSDEIGDDYEIDTDDDMDSDEDMDLDNDMDSDEDMDLDNDMDSDDDMDFDSEDSYDDSDETDTEMEDSFDFDAENAESDELDGENNEWSQFDRYKNSNGEYDLVNANEEDVIKITKLLADDDDVAVEMVDGQVFMKDYETDSEYLIDLDGDDFNNDDFNDDEIESVVESVMNDYGKHPSYRKEPFTLPNGENKGGYGQKIGSSDPYGETPSENSSMVTEDFDYDEYFGNNDVNEEEIEENVTISSPNVTRMTKKPSKNFPSGRPVRNVSENTLKKYAKEIKALKEEREMAIKTLNMFKNKLEEALVTNQNLGKVVKLFTEHSTTKNEKVDIIKRFANSAKTVNESNNLYKTINNELKRKSSINESTRKVDIKLGSQKQNMKETTIYKNPQINESINLMQRMNLIK